MIAVNRFGARPLSADMTVSHHLAHHRFGEFSMNRTARLIAVSALALTLPLGLTGCKDDTKSVTFGTSSPGGAGGGATVAPTGAASGAGGVSVNGNGSEVTVTGEDGQVTVNDNGVTVTGDAGGVTVDGNGGVVVSGVPGVPDVSLGQ